MEFRLDWIAEHTDLPEAVEEAAAVLTRVGLTTDGWREAGGTWLLDLDLPANRGDVLAHRGIAREAAAALGRPLTPLDTGFAAHDGRARSPVEISIEDPELCPRYTGRIIEDVAPGSSPVRVEERLESLGHRAVSNIVDATNLVLLELGQPLHAFDLDKLAGGCIIVRRARPGESLVTLDEVERKLAPEDLVIADAEKPVALAGVMGGLESMIGPDTTRVLLESAHLDPRSVRATATRLGMRTDASIRFERGTDPKLTLLAADRFCHLLESMGGGRFIADPVDVVAAEPPSPELELRWDRAESLMGMPLDRERLTGVLEALGFELLGSGDGILRVRVPTWRADVTREIDLVEEVARHQGFEEIPSTLPAWTEPAVSASETLQHRREGLRTATAAAGFLETVHFAFIDEETDATFRRRPGEDRAPLLSNPLVQHQKAMRGSLLPGLLGAAQRNLARGREDLRLFELGKRFWLTQEEEPQEAWTLAILAGGPAPGWAVWESGGRATDFFDLKGALEAALTACGTTPRFEPGEDGVMAPQACARVLWREQDLGPAGRVHDEVAARFDLEDPVFAAELDLTPLLEGTDRAFTMESPSRYPWADRDLSLLLPEEVSWDRVREAVLGLGQETLRQIWPLDRYAGEGVPEGRVSLTLRLRYQSRERTLEAAEVQELSDAVVECLTRRVDAVLRGS